MDHFDFEYASIFVTPIIHLYICLFSHKLNDKMDILYDFQCYLYLPVASLNTISDVFLTMHVFSTTANIIYLFL